MKESLRAWDSWLKFQKDESCQQLLQCTQQKLHLEQNISTIMQKISSSCTIHARIVPEYEMARSQFVMHEQQKINDFEIKKIQIIREELVLTQQKLQINIQLKQLERHQKNMLTHIRCKNIKLEQDKIDEWVMQRQDYNEN